MSPHLGSQSFLGFMEACWSLLPSISISSSLLTRLWIPTWCVYLCKIMRCELQLHISFTITLGKLIWNLLLALPRCPKKCPRNPSQKICQTNAERIIIFSTSKKHRRKQQKQNRICSGCNFPLKRIHSNDDASEIKSITVSKGG